MKFEQTITIYPKDTDCYDIVWHGKYLELFEVGRIELLELMGLSFKKVHDMGILLPVVEINCRYKTPARMMDKVCISTSILELKKVSISFSHVIKKLEADKIILNASTAIVATDKAGNLYKKIPDLLYDKFLSAFKSYNGSLSLTTKHV